MDLQILFVFTLACGFAAIFFSATLFARWVDEERLVARRMRRGSRWCSNRYGLDGAVGLICLVFMTGAVCAEIWRM